MLLEIAVFIFKDLIKISIKLAAAMVKISEHLP